MEKIKNLVGKQSRNMKYCFILGALIAAINSLSRADYNFILYLYMFYVWTFMDNETTKNQDKIYLFYLLVFSALVDIFWCLFWGDKWDYVSTLVHELTLLFSWIGVIIKIIIICCVGILEFDKIVNHIVNLIQKKRNDGFVPQNDD